MDDLLPGMLDLARQGGETLTRQLTDQLRDLITGGRLAPGQRLPSSRQLAGSLDVSRNTVSFAIEQLAAEGYVTLSAGRRPAVAEGLVLDRRKISSRTNASDGVSLSLGTRSATFELAAHTRQAAPAVSARTGG
jgi:GntR family transcriptional regulator / MocR family aminotransferase